MTQANAKPLTIGLNLRVANLPRVDGNSAVMRSLAAALARNAGEHRLVYFFDAEPLEPFRGLPNVEHKVLRPFPVLNGALLRIGGGDPWYRFRLRLSPAWNRLDAAVYNAHEPVPAGGGPPGVAIVHDLAFMLPDAQRYFPLDVIRHLDRWTAESVHAATRVMAVSATTAADLMRIYGVPESKVVVLPNAHDSDMFHARIPAVEVEAALTELRVEKPYFLHVGTAQPRKNIPAITRAFESLLAKNEIPHSLVLVGGAGWDAAGEGSDKIPRSERIIQLSSTSNEQVACLMAGADALVIAGFYEGFGLPALEAMACGAPVVAARAGALPEVVGEAGKYFDPNDPDELAGIMESLAADETLRRELSRRGLNRAAAFGWGSTARGLLSAIEEFA